MVAHNEETAVGDLVREGDIAVAEGFFGEVGFVEGEVVDEDITVVIDIDPIAGAADNALYQYFIVVVKGSDIAGLKGGSFDGEDYFPVRQCGSHGSAVDLKNGQPESSDKDSEGGDGDEGVDGAAENRPITPLVLNAPELILKLTDGGHAQLFFIFH